MRNHTISVLVENHSGALSRIAGLFSSRGYNISSLTVAETEDKDVSRMTIVVFGDDRILEQVTKQLNRLVDVIKVIDFQNAPVLDRELLLIKINASKGESRQEIISLVNVFGGKVLSVAKSHMTVELAAESRGINDFIMLVNPFGIKELVRTGKVAIA